MGGARGSMPPRQHAPRPPTTTHRSYVKTHKDVHPRSRLTYVGRYPRSSSRPTQERMVVSSN